MENVAGLPPAIGLDPTVAEQIAKNITRAHESTMEEFLFPGSENLYIVFRSVDDFSEFRDRVVSPDVQRLDESQAEVQMAINTLVVSSTSSYALVDGERVEIGLPLGLRLYQLLFSGQNGDASPMTDGEAVALMFGTDTLALVMFARRLRVWQKVTAAALEANPGKS